jgi:hypothetical protein
MRRSIEAKALGMFLFALLIIEGNGWRELLIKLGSYGRQASLRRSPSK